MLSGFKNWVCGRTDEFDALRLIDQEVQTYFEKMTS